LCVDGARVDDDARAGLCSEEERQQGKTAAGDDGFMRTRAWRAVRVRVGE
jgi:hypothetical protein